MIDHTQENATESALQERIRELEQENARLHGELERRKPPADSRLSSVPAYGRAFEQVAIGYAMTDPEGRFVDANPAYLRLTGYTLDELKERRLSDLIHPDDYPVNMRLIERQMADEIPPFVIENRYVRKDGGIVWVRKNAAWVLGPYGRPQWLLSLVEDITHHRQVEEEHRISERIYRAIGDAIPYGIWICDPEGRNIYASQSYLDLVGITQEECSEYGWGNTLHPDDAERTIAAWKECVRTEGVWDIEHRFLGTDGKYHPILARGVPVRDDHGKIICWAGINLDISGLKETQEALRQAEERFRIAIQGSPIVVYTTDRQLRYTWIFNPAFGRKPEDLIGKTDEEARGPEEAMELVPLKQAVLETGIRRRQEIQISHGGVDHTFDVTVEPTRDEHGAVTGLTVAAIDVTDSKRREKKVLQSHVRIELQRRLLEQREQERMTLARDLHDGPIQTLAATGMDLDIIRSVFDDPALQIELSRIDRHIRDASRELRDVVSELRPSQLHSIGLSPSIRAYVEELRKKHPQLKFRLELAAGKDRFSRYASLGLFRICQEALNNVVRHAAATAVNIHLSFTPDCGTLEIQDNGRGMDCLPDFIELATAGHYGLAGMKERAEAVGGEFRLLSEPGKGTSVIVSVPLDALTEELD